MLIEDDLIIELKSVDEVQGINEAQPLTYMKLSGIKTGLLINFNVTQLKNGIKRYVLYNLRALRVLRGVLRLLNDREGRWFWDAGRGCRVPASAGKAEPGDARELPIAWEIDG